MIREYLAKRKYIREFTKSVDAKKIAGKVFIGTTKELENMAKIALAAQEFGALEVPRILSHYDNAVKVRSIHMGWRHYTEMLPNHHIQRFKNKV